MKKVLFGIRSCLFILLAALTASASLFSQAHATPGITEYPLPADIGYTRMTNGPDGALWFTESQTGKIGRINLSGAVTEYAVSSSNPNGPGLSGATTSGPDGNLWTTGSENGDIIRMTPSGNVTTFPVPVPNPSSPAIYNITTGPDGALWFTEGGTGVGGDNGTIGRITTDGSISQFTVPAYDSDGSQPYDIVAGSDGALWFTEFGSSGGIPAGYIGRVSIGGGFSEYPIPLDNLGQPLSPGAIVNGPDGALWFTSVDNSKVVIGKVAASGQITEYPVPAIDSTSVAEQSFSITVGPDGALWFGMIGINPDITQYTGAVGRITTSGQIITYHLNGSVFGVTAAPDGAIWFAEGTGYLINKIARLVPQADITPPTISSLSWSANPLMQGQNTTLSVAASDDLSGVSSVQYSVDDGAPQQMTFDSSSGTWQARFGSNLSASAYNITITATDGAGNTSSGTNDILAIYNTTNGYVTGHAKTLPAASDTMPIARDTSNNPARLIAGFTNVTSPSSGSFDVDYSIKNNQNEFLLSSTGINWVVVTDSAHASILGTADLTTYVNGVKTVTQNVSARFDVVLGGGSTPDHMTIRIYNPGVNTNTGSPTYTISDDVTPNGSNLMIHR